jgi:hypothetical protein
LKTACGQAVETSLSWQRGTNRCDNACATIRAKLSAACPAGKPTIMRTGCDA